MIFKLIFSVWLLYSPFWSTEKLISFPDFYETEITAVDDALFEGQWQGMATTQKEKTRVILHIEKNQGGLAASITLPDMGVMGWPARDAKLNGDQLTLSFPTDTSKQIIVLSLDEDKEGISFLEGTWQDTGLEEIAHIRLDKEIGIEDLHSIPVTVNGPAGSISAEIILPSGTGPFPGIVFLHGSGPQPKDASRFAAYSLAEEGIASVIFDKRGVGQSEGSWQGADFEDLARDGIAVAEYFSSQYNLSYIGFFGHSQGGWIGPLAAKMWEQSAFVISSAGPAVSPAREAQWGFIYNAMNAGATEEDIILIRRVVESWHEGLRSGNWDRYKEDVDKSRSKPWFGASGLEYLQYPPDPEQLKYYLPFMDYDPMPTFRNLNKPLYSILSPDDESIDAQETEIILKALVSEGKDIRIKLYPGYNHGFRRLGMEGPLRWPGHPEDYFKLQAEFIKSVAP